MTLDANKIGEAELLAYVDGELSPEDRILVENFLKTHPDQDKDVAEWQHQAKAIKALFDQVSQEPVPARLNPRHLARTSQAANTNFWRSAAAAIVLTVVSTSIGWHGRDLIAPLSPTSQTLLTAAVDAHELFTPQKLHAVEVGANESEHLMSWLSTSLDRSFALPNDLPNGFTLTGGRLLSTPDSPAALLIYEANGKRISLFLTPRLKGQSRETLFETQDGVAALYWANSAITCTIVGDLSRVEMESIARQVYEALNWQYKGQANV